MGEDSAALAQPYEIVSVRRTEPPHGGRGSNWYRYEIVQGENTIKGYRQGSLKVVTRDVEEIVAQLNQRRTGKCSRVHLVMSTPSRANKKK